MLKMKFLTIMFAATLGIGLFPASVFADDDPYTAEITWERYKIASAKVSVEFPKFPVFAPEGFRCTEYGGENFYAFADDVVYRMLVIYKIPIEQISKSCFELFRTPWPFDKDLLKRRILEHEYENENKVKKYKLKDGREVEHIVKGLTRTWIFDDIENGKVVELSITHRKDKDPDVSRFLDSLDLSGKKTGTEFGEGSNRTLGDKVTDPKNAATQPIGDDKPQIGEDEDMVILSRPRADYTEAAREAGLQGTVRLRVVFLSNGGVGNISVLKELPLGMTEAAIKAAKRIVFLPRKVNGRKVNLARIFEYNFSLY